MDEAEAISVVKKLIDDGIKSDFIRSIFETILNKKEDFPDLWKIYVKFSEKNYSKTNIKTKVCRRALRHLPNDHHLSTEVLFDVHRSSQISGDLESLRAVYTELSHRFIVQGTQNLKLAETYFKLLVNHTVRKYQDPDFIEDLEYLKATIDYFNKVFGDKKELNFNDRKSLASIYKSYISLILRLESSEFDKESVTDVCERLVKISGNEPENWLIYLSFLRHVHDLGTRDPIRAIYKRAIRFCKGDITKIYEEYKEYELLFGDNLDEITKIDELYKSLQGNSSTDHGRDAKGKSRVEIHSTMPDAKAHKLKSMGTIYEKQEKANLTVFIKGLPLKIERAQVTDLLPNVKFSKPGGQRN